MNRRSTLHVRPPSRSLRFPASPREHLRSREHGLDAALETARPKGEGGAHGASGARARIAREIRGLPLARGSDRGESLAPYENPLQHSPTPMQEPRDTAPQPTEVGLVPERCAREVDYAESKVTPGVDFKRILVVDDDVDHLSTVGEVLGEEGYIVDLASSGRDALKRMLRRPPDLILLDLMMPEMDGWTLYAELRKRRAFSNVPVVMMSKGGEDVLTRAPVASGYLAKPLHRRTLLETVASCLLRSRSR